MGQKLSLFGATSSWGLSLANHNQDKNILRDFPGPIRMLTPSLFPSDSPRIQLSTGFGVLLAETHVEHARIGFDAGVRMSTSLARLPADTPLPFATVRLPTHALAAVRGPFNSKLKPHAPRRRKFASSAPCAAVAGVGKHGLAHKPLDKLKILREYWTRAKTIELHYPPLDLGHLTEKLARNFCEVASIGSVSPINTSWPEAKPKSSLNCETYKIAAGPGFYNDPIKMVSPADYLKPKISGNGAVFSEECLSVQVVGLSGTTWEDSM
ncbi:hypothetical protein B0H11DRAFT_1938706 [Mycena galericulata]|nr:hypothetical protein B0H11DRAFT_1938706 [Mycena galericulata]